MYKETERAVLKESEKEMFENKEKEISLYEKIKTKIRELRSKIWQM